MSNAHEVIQMNNQDPNSKHEGSPFGMDRREFLAASAGLVAAPLLAGVAAQALAKE